VLCRAELHKRALQSERTAAYFFAEKSMWEIQKAIFQRGGMFLGQWGRLRMR